MDDDPEDVSEFSGFFSRRAKFVPKLSSEELQAASKLIQEIRNEGKKGSLTDVTVPVPIPLSDPRPVPIAIPKSDPAPTKKRGKRIKEKTAALQYEHVESEIVTVNDGLESSPLPLSAAAKRRLRKVQRDCEKELKSVTAANNKVLSSLNTSNTNEVEEVDIDDNERYITILYLSEVSRLTCQEDEKFLAIFQRVADLLQLNVSEFLLCFKNRNIKVDDTPRSLNLTYSDIVECIPYKGQGIEAERSDINNFQMFFQASDKKGKTEIFTHELEKMQVVMEKYSKIRNISLEEMRFEFDGEQISGKETPKDLDMESGSCVDVRILNVDKDLENSRFCSKNLGNVIDLTADDDDDVCYNPDIIFCD